jgi:hypothetical protein
MADDMLKKEESKTRVKEGRQCQRKNKQKKKKENKE